MNPWTTLSQRNIYVNFLANLNIRYDECAMKVIAHITAFSYIGPVIELSVSSAKSRSRLEPYYIA